MALFPVVKRAFVRSVPFVTRHEIRQWLQIRFCPFCPFCHAGVESDNAFESGFCPFCPFCHGGIQGEFKLLGSVQVLRLHAFKCV